MSKAEKGILYLSVNETHMMLSEDPKGYVICRTTENDNDFGSVLREKYYNHLSDIYSGLIDTWLQKANNLEQLFLSLVDNSLLDNLHMINVSNACQNIRKVSLPYCIGLSANNDTEWSSYFENHRDRFIQIDNALHRLSQLLIAECNKQSLADKNLVIRGFSAYASLISKIRSLAKTFGTEPRHLENNRLLLRTKMTNMEALSCVSQLLGMQLSARDAQHFFNSLYNAKLVFCREFSDVINISDYSLFTVHDSSRENKRVKRWFFTYSLSQLTGLADDSVVSALSKETQLILKGEQQDAEQIVSLDKKANEMLSSIKNQDDKLGKLYSDESVLNDKLRTVMRDEYNLTVKMSTLVFALEAVSDVHMEYSNFNLLFESVDLLFGTKENQVASLQYQKVSSEQLPVDNLVGKFGISALNSVKVTGRVHSGGYSIVYTVPEIVEEFLLKAVKVLPVPLQRNLWGSAKIGNALVAINEKGWSFLYDDRVCVSRGSSTVCEPELLEVHCKPMFCEEELIVQKSFGKVCVNSMSLYSPTVQSYIYHDEIDQVSIFSPVNDTLRLKCSSNIVDTVVPVGITVFSLPSGCIAISSQLIIFSKSSVWNEGIVPQIFNIDLSRDIDDLTRYIEEIHDVNFTVIEQDFMRYSQSVNNTRLDIAEVKKSLDDFKRINSIKEYSPLRIDWDDSYALSNVAMISGLLATILFVLFVLIVCCKCCSCCSLGTRLCKCAGKSCECCFNEVRKLSVRKADISAESSCGKDDISLSQRNNNNICSEVIWEIENIGERLVLFAE
jgi:hypothetical protein